MRVIIDNATLTASFRALGLIKSRKPELFDLDVSALRVLIDAIVLADQIIIADNYKPEFSKERKSWINHKSIVFEKFSPGLNRSIQKHAFAHVHNWRMERHLSSDLSGVFDDLSIMFRYAWRNSNSFLVMKSLGLKSKYNSTLVDALRRHLSSESLEDRDEIKKFSAKFFNKETERIVQSISWAAVRSVYYRQVAKILGCEYWAHPLRNVFNMKCILFDNHPDTRKYKLHSERVVPHEESLNLWLLDVGYHRKVNDFFRHFWQECNKADDNIFGVQTYDVDLPPFLSFVIKNAREAYQGDILNEAFKLRDTSAANSLRKKLSEIHKEINEDEKNTKLRNFIVELRNLRKGLQKYLGYDRERVPITVKVVEYKQTVPRCMIKPLYPHKPHLVFIRDVILELSNSASLGRLLDYLWTSTS